MKTYEPEPESESKIEMRIPKLIPYKSPDNISKCHNFSRHLDPPNEKYVKISYNLKKDINKQNLHIPIYILKNNNTYIQDADNTLIKTDIPNGVYNYILFQNIKDEYILVLSLFNPQEIGTKHNMIYNRLDSSNTDYDHFLISGELNYNVVGGVYTIEFNDESSLYWNHENINLKIELFLHVLRIIVLELISMDIDINMSNKVQVINGKEVKVPLHKRIPFWKKYITDHMRTQGFIYHPMFSTFKSLKDALQKITAYSKSKDIRQVAGCFDIEEGYSLYKIELNKLMSNAIQHLHFFKDISGTISYTKHINKPITNEQYFSEKCYDDLGECVVGSDVIVKVGTRGTKFYNKRGKILNCNPDMTIQEFRKAQGYTTDDPDPDMTFHEARVYTPSIPKYTVQFTDTSLGTKNVDKNKVYSRSALIDELYVYDDYDSCEYEYCYNDLDDCTVGKDVFIDMGARGTKFSNKQGKILQCSGEDGSSDIYKVKFIDDELGIEYIGSDKVFSVPHNYDSLKHYNYCDMKEQLCDYY